jgi:hypothetical protein
MGRSSPLAEAVKVNLRFYYRRVSYVCSLHGTARLQKLISRSVKELPHVFVKSEDSLPRSRDPAAVSY